LRYTLHFAENESRLSVNGEKSMSAIFNEYLIFRQDKGPDVELVVNGDEFYARYETVDGYTVVYDMDLGLYCYATLENGAFVSTGTPIAKGPPVGLRRHLKESPEVRNRKFRQRYDTIRPAQPEASAHMVRTFGPQRGLLAGRRVSTGQVRGLTILVEFADLQSSVTAADVDGMLNGASYTANGNFCSVREYYRLISGGKLDYTNAVVGPIRLAREQSFYKNTLFVREVMDIVAAQRNNDFADFDSQSQGIIDAVSFLYAGRTVYEGELWPHNFQIDLRYGAYRTSQYMLTSMGRSRVDLSIGTFCHESGHLLCRFPDMYDYGERDGDFESSHGIGAYCLMGSGNHLDRGRTPSPVCGYLRDLVGWTDNQVTLNSVGEFQAKHGDYRTVLKYETDRPNEYFIVENRSRLGLDGGLPADGLAVYHCDWLGSNEWQGGTADKHYQCGLLQADGHLDLERNVNGGDASDLFGGRTGVVLSHDTTPSSRQWDGAESGLVIGEIGTPGETMRFRIGEQVKGNVARAEITTDLLIPDNQPAGVQSRATIAERGSAKSIKVHVSIIHTYIGDLQVELVAPSGKKALLHDKKGGGQDDLKQTWTSQSLPALAALNGEAIEGQWTLAIRDLARRDTGRLNWWLLEIDYEPSARVVEMQAQPNIAIPDASPTGIESSLAMSQSGALSEIQVGVQIAHTYRGDLVVDVVTPSGRTATLHNRDGGSKHDLRVTYDRTSAPALSGLIGEPIQGDWKLRVRDLAQIDQGTLEGWSLRLSY
jgi:M6 family metalloprotease-like protein